MGADNQEAPWNKEETPISKFEVIVTQTLSKRVILNTTDYTKDGEDIDTSETDWEHAYDNDHMLPSLLLEKMVDILGNLLMKMNDPEGLSIYVKKNRGKFYSLKNECMDWKEIDREVDEE